MYTISNNQHAMVQALGVAQELQGMGDSTNVELKSLENLLFLKIFFICASPHTHSNPLWPRFQSDFIKIKIHYFQNNKLTCKALALIPIEMGPCVTSHLAKSSSFWGSSTDPLTVTFTWKVWIMWAFSHDKLFLKNTSIKYKLQVQKVFFLFLIIINHFPFLLPFQRFSFA